MLRLQRSTEIIWVVVVFGGYSFCFPVQILWDRELPPCENYRPHMDGEDGNPVFIHSLHLHLASALFSLTLSFSAFTVYCICGRGWGRGLGSWTMELGYIYFTAYKIEDYFSLSSVSYTLGHYKNVTVFIRHRWQWLPIQSTSQKSKFFVNSLMTHQSDTDNRWTGADSCEAHGQCPWLGAQPLHHRCHKHSTKCFLCN